MPRQPQWREWFFRSFGFHPEHNERERFLRHVAIDGECWLWTGPDDYMIDGVPYDPVQMAYVMLVGPALAGEVETSCGHRCCSSNHLIVCVKQSA